MKLNQEGINLILSFEGFESQPYICAGGKATIGYGTTVYPNGVKVTMQDPPITKATAKKLFEATIIPYENAVAQLVKYPITENQAAALISFTYNVGIANFKSSTLLKRVNANTNDPAIRTEFSKWIKAKGKILNGLIKRRKAESDLYFKR